ncbi:MAG: hypothetical protein NVSMB14_01140 [Isosphaeraceae bacterium]
MRRQMIGLTVGVLVFTTTGVVQAQGISGFNNFNNAFSAAYGFNFVPSVAANAERFALQPQLNNLAIQRQDALERRDGFVGEEDLALPGLDELDPSTLSERDRFGGRSRGSINRMPRRSTLTANVRRGYPSQFYNRSTSLFYPEAALGSHSNANRGGKGARSSGGGGFGGGFGGGVGGIGMF